MGTAFLLFHSRYFQPHVTTIIGYLTTGIAVDSIVTFMIYVKLLKDDRWHDLNALVIIDFG